MPAPRCWRSPTAISPSPRRAAEAIGPPLLRHAAPKPRCPSSRSPTRSPPRKKPGDKPLLLADTSDQTGGGAPGDTTYMIKALHRCRHHQRRLWPALGSARGRHLLCRSASAQSCRLKIGGKFEPHSGPSLDVDAEVLFLKRDAYQDQLDQRARADGRRRGDPRRGHRDPAQHPPRRRLLARRCSPTTASRSRTSR